VDCAFCLHGVTQSKVHAREREIALTGESEERQRRNMAAAIHISASQNIAMTRDRE
jgi:hypothetical protein